MSMYRLIREPPLRNDGTIGEIVGGSYMGHPDKYNGGDGNRH